MTTSTASFQPTIPPKPRWAREIDDDKWIRLNRLVIENWSAPAILREIKIPAKKKRSLQFYARSFSARRRIAQFETLKNTLITASAECAQDIRSAYRKIVRMAAGESVDPRTRIRAFEAAAMFTRTLDNIVKSDFKPDEGCEEAFEVLNDEEHDLLLQDAINNIDVANLPPLQTRLDPGFVLPNKVDEPVSLPHSPSKTAFHQNGKLNGKVKTS